MLKFPLKKKESHHPCLVLENKRNQKNKEAIKRSTGTMVH